MEENRYPVANIGRGAHESAFLYVTVKRSEEVEHLVIRQATDANSYAPASNGSYPQAPEGRKGCMRYVAMAVAIGLLVVGIGVYTAQAAQGRAARDSRLIEWPGTENTITTSFPVWKDKLEQARLVHAAQVELERKQQERERKRAEAVARFGEWGPYLVEAAEMYGQDPAALYRTMICESKGDPNADNGVCKGLFQFNPSTWAGTPYGGQSIYDGRAQALAAAWMWSQGRKGEWTCV